MEHRTPRRRSILQDISSDSSARRLINSAGNVSYFANPVSPDEEIIQARTEQYWAYRDQQLSDWPNSSFDSSGLYDSFEYVCMSPREREEFERRSKEQRIRRSKSPDRRSSTESHDMSASSAWGCDSEFIQQVETLDDSLIFTQSPIQPPRNCSSPLVGACSTAPELKQRRIAGDILTADNSFSPRQLFHSNLMIESQSVVNVDHCISCLLNLCATIYQSIPSNRLQSSRDSYAFRKVKPHLSLFRKTILDHLRKLIEMESWDMIVRYVAKVWRCVHRLPKWEYESHNAVKAKLFDILASACLKALRQMDLTILEINSYFNRLNQCLKYSSTMQPCLNYLKKLGSSRDILPTSYTS